MDKSKTLNKVTLSEIDRGIESLKLMLYEGIYEDDISEFAEQVNRLIPEIEALKKSYEERCL